MARAVQPTFDTAVATAVAAAPIVTSEGEGDGDGDGDGGGAASGGEGTASPFRTLGRLRGIKWDVPDSVEGETVPVPVNVGSESDSEGPAPCKECLEALRAEWEEEALKIWNMIDHWIEE